MAGQIKGCPFCGGRPYPKSSYSEKHKCTFVWIKCKVCGAQSKIYRSEELIDFDNGDWNDACEEAFDAWQTRFG